MRAVAAIAGVVAMAGIGTLAGLSTAARTPSDPLVTATVRAVTGGCHINYPKVRGGLSYRMPMPWRSGRLRYRSGYAPRGSAVPCHEADAELSRVAGQQAESARRARRSFDEGRFRAEAKIIDRRVLVLDHGREGQSVEAHYNAADLGLAYTTAVRDGDQLRVARRALNARR